jgi:two-component system sensor histidine kinase DesK
LENLPQQIKLTYFAAIIVMLFLVGFILMVVRIYNKKQLLYQKEKQLRESEYQNNLLREEIKRQTAIQKERERISHDMHDELGAGISALKLQVEFIKLKAESPEVKEDLNDLLNTAKNMNLSMREMLWSLNSENDNLGNFVKYIFNYAENFLEKTNIALHTSKSGIENSQNISSETRRNLLLCIKEVLNNAYKHSEAQNLWLDISQNQKAISIKIKDDGIGLKSTSQQGNGLKNMKIRMQKCNGEFLIPTSEKGLSLEFLVKLN